MVRDGVNLLRVLSCVVMLSWGATSAAELRLFGNSLVQADSTFEVRIALDAPLVATIDDLELTIVLPPQFIGDHAQPGLLLIGTHVGSVDLNAPGAFGNALFLSPQAGLPVGDLATWTFRFAPGVVPGGYALQASLSTFQQVDIDIFPFPQEDRVLTANLISAPFQIQVVPEPATYASMLAGLAVLFAYSRRRRRSTSD